jgi:hypothetical protein
VYAIPGGSQLTNIFLFVFVFIRNSFVCFVVSIHVRNTETNRKINFWFHETKRFKPKIFFVSFEDTLVGTKLES